MVFSPRIDGKVKIGVQGGGGEERWENRDSTPIYQP